MSFFDLFKDIGDRLGISSSGYPAKPKSKRGDSAETSSSAASGKPQRRIIDYDKKEGGVLNCPQVDYNEVVSFSACKACPYHEGPSLRNFFMRSCLFDKNKHTVGNKPSPRWVKDSHKSSSQSPSFPSLGSSFESRGPLSRDSFSRGPFSSQDSFSTSDRRSRQLLGSPFRTSSEPSSRSSPRSSFFGRNRRLADPLERRAEEIYDTTEEILNELLIIEQKLRQIRADALWISREIKNREEDDRPFR